MRLPTVPYQPGRPVFEPREPHPVRDVVCPGLPGEDVFGWCAMQCVSVCLPAYFPRCLLDQNQRSDRGGREAVARVVRTVRSHRASR